MTEQTAGSVQDQLAAAQSEIEQLMGQRQQEQAAFQETYDEQCRALGEATLQLRVLGRQFNEVSNALAQAQAQAQDFHAQVEALRAQLDPEPSESDSDPEIPVSGNREGGKDGDGE